MAMTIDPWLTLLQNLPLSRTERELVKRYQQDPHGRAFLPIADILRAHRLTDEGLELLSQGVARHPNFTVARVILVRELFAKGLIDQALQVLDECPEPLRDNVLAHKIRFKLAVLTGDEVSARDVFEHMKLRQMLDDEIRSLGQLLELFGLSRVEEKLLQDFRDRGVTVSRTVQTHRSPQMPVAELAVAEAAPTAPNRMLVPGNFDSRSEGFHVIPLGDIFKEGDLNGGINIENAIELDSTTLADIYAKQGHFTKALAIYKRLLRLSPGNELLKKRVAEMTKKEQNQRVEDVNLDADLIERMENIEVIDRQIKFFHGLLNRLSP